MPKPTILASRRPSIQPSNSLPLMKRQNPFRVPIGNKWQSSLLLCKILAGRNKTDDRADREQSEIRQRSFHVGNYGGGANASIHHVGRSCRNRARRCQLLLNSRGSLSDVECGRRPPPSACCSAASCPLAGRFDIVVASNRALGSEAALA
jgi:hypothetical protein